MLTTINHYMRYSNFTQFVQSHKHLSGFFFIFQVLLLQSVNKQELFILNQLFVHTKKFKVQKHFFLAKTYAALHFTKSPLKTNIKIL